MYIAWHYDGKTMTPPSEFYQHRHTLYDANTEIVRKTRGGTYGPMQKKLTACASEAIDAIA